MTRQQARTAERTRGFRITRLLQTAYHSIRAIGGHLPEQPVAQRRKVDERHPIALADRGGRARHFH
jgi:hypothetical protein